MPLSVYGAQFPNAQQYYVLPNAPLWRYMDTEKYLDLLTRRALWFVRGATLQSIDPYEGTQTEADNRKIAAVVAATNMDELRQAFVQAGWQGYLRNIDVFQGKSFRFHQLLLLTRLTYIDTTALATFVSCWHENSGESDAMWKVYTQKGSGVALKSSVERMISAMASTDRQVVYSRVSYGNELTALSDGNYDSLLNKRGAFAHEKEVRLLAHCLDGFEAPNFTDENKLYNVGRGINVPDGMHIACDLPRLIDEVVLSPLMPTWACDAITEVTKSYLPETKIRKSNHLSAANHSIAMSPELKQMLQHYYRTKKLTDIGEF